MSLPWKASTLLAAIFLGVLGLARAQNDFEQDPVEMVLRYRDTNGISDPVALLQNRLNKGKARLRFDENRGYLSSLLKQLRIPISSQGLVFSKTSSQADHTTSRTPRAIYFADDVAV